MMFFFRVLGFWLCMIGSASATELQARWDQAVEWVETGRVWGPGRVETHVREVNKHGEQLSIEFLQVTRKRGADGRSQTKLVRASRDGEDVTASRREKIDRIQTRVQEEAARADKDKKGNPFAAVTQPGLVLEDLKQAKTVDGVMCMKVGFTYAQKNKKTFTGTAWIATENGKPIRATVELLDRPWMAKSVVTELTYGDVAGGSWGVTLMKLKAHGGMMGMMRYIETAMTLSEHWSWD